MVDFELQKRAFKKKYLDKDQKNARLVSFLTIIL